MNSKDFSREFYDIVRRNIDRSGQHLQAVFAGEKDDEPEFIYTIGNHQHGLPELLMVGACTEQWGRLLNLIGKQLRERKLPFDDGGFVSVGGKYPVKILNMPQHVKDRFTIQVGRYYNVAAYDVQQVIVCDQDGRFPGDTGCSDGYCSQLDLTVGKVQ